MGLISRISRLGKLDCSAPCGPVACCDPFPNCLANLSEPFDYTSSQSVPWPAGAWAVDIWCIGRGGVGGNSLSAGAAGGGGGGGASAHSYNVSKSGASLDLTIDATSSKVEQAGTKWCEAVVGGAGSNSPNGAGGAGGADWAGGGATKNFSGGDGAAGVDGTAAGGGGGGAGTNQAGLSATGGVGGKGGAEKGGNGGDATAANGEAGANYGGGGAGGYNNGSGGAGGQGLVRLVWVYPIELVVSVTGAPDLQKFCPLVCNPGDTYEWETTDTILWGTALNQVAFTLEQTAPRGTGFKLWLGDYENDCTQADKVRSGVLVRTYYVTKEKWCPTDEITGQQTQDEWFLVTITAQIGCVNGKMILELIAYGCCQCYRFYDADPPWGGGTGWSSWICYAEYSGGVFSCPKVCFWDEHTKKAAPCSEEEMQRDVRWQLPFLSEAYPCFFTADFCGDPPGSYTPGTASAWLSFT